MGLLQNVIVGRQVRPVRALIYGVEGVGKSTFGADAPRPIFVGAEDGTSELDVARFPTPRTFGDVIAALDALATEPHDYRTVVLDTLDALEPLAWAHVVATRPQKNGTKADSIEAYGYGAGYVHALDAWRDVMSRLDAIRAKGCNVVVVGHSCVKSHANPTGDNFDRYELKLHKLAAAAWKEWADAVLFSTHEVLTTRKTQERAKGVSTGVRVIHTEHSAAWDAKNRYSLPAQLPLSWAAFAEAIAGSRATPIGAIVDEIDDLLRGLDAALAERVSAARVAAGDDPIKLTHVLNRLRATKREVVT